MTPLDMDRAKVDAAAVVEQDMVEAIKEDVAVVVATAPDAEEPLGMEDSLPGRRNAYTVKRMGLAKMTMMHYS
jgi:malate synthase